MAPEQLSGKKLLEKTDIFALGGILYFLLYLEAPFDEKSCRKRLSNPFDVHPKFDNLKKPKFNCCL